MESSLLAIIPTAALVGGIASFVTTIWREKTVQRREDERLRFDIEWRLKANKLEKLLDVRKKLPPLGFPSKRQANGQPVLDIEELLKIAQEFIRFTDLEVKPLLSADKRSEIEEPELFLASWMNEMAQAFHGKAKQPDVPGEKLQELYQVTTSSIIGEIDMIESNIKNL